MTNPTLSFVAPARLPDPPDSYDRQTFDQLNKALRVWMTLIATASNAEQGMGAFASKTATFTAGKAEGNFSIDTTGGVVVANLPVVSTVTGQFYRFKRVTAGANALTITPNGSDTIDGAATFSLPTQWQCLTIFSTGVTWYVISKYL